MSKTERWVPDPITEAERDVLASLRAGTHRLVTVEILDRFPEINPSNYDHDEACALNAWGVEVVLAAAPGDTP